MEKNKLYPEIARQEKAEMISADIRFKREMLAAASRIDLKNLKVVTERTQEYLSACEAAATIPTFIGLATAFGMSRQNLYSFLSTHAGSPSAEYLEVVRDVLADSLVTASLTRTTDAATSIFILKNLHGFVDKLEVSPSEPEPPLGRMATQEELEARINASVVEDQEVNYDTTRKSSKYPGTESTGTDGIVHGTAGSNQCSSIRFNKTDGTRGRNPSRNSSSGATAR